MWKLRSDKGFVEFIKRAKLSSVLPIVILGVLLLLLSSAFGSDDGEKEKSKTGEDRLYEICSMVEGVGECRVMITYENEEVYAVAVLCEGAGSVEVRERIVELVSSLYGIGSHRIAVLELSESKV